MSAEHTPLIPVAVILPKQLKIADIHTQGLFLNNGEIAVAEVGEDGQRILTVDAIDPPRRDAYRHKDEVRDAIAARVVLTWNAHDALVKALEIARENVPADRMVNVKKPDGTGYMQVSALAELDAIYALVFGSVS